MYKSINTKNCTSEINKTTRNITYKKYTKTDSRKNK